MEHSSLLPLPKGMRLLTVTLLRDAVHLETSARRRTGMCPRCQTASTRVHSYYTRTVAEMPWMGREVTLTVHVRKFRCPNVACPQRVFSERFPEYLRPWARKTVRLQLVIRSLGLALGGRGTEKLAPHLGVKVSGTTALRLLMTVADPPMPALPPVRVLGVDDFVHC